jgi:hypothetical protein
VGAGVEPGHAAPEVDQLRLAALEVVVVDVGDLELAARRRLQPGGDVDDLVVVHVQAGDREVRLRHRRLLLDGEDFCSSKTPRHAVALGILHLIAEERAAAELGDLFLQHPGEAVAVEDVVAEGEADVVGADELAADDERLGEAVGLGLLGVLDAQADVVAVAQQPLGRAADRGASR